MAIAAGIYGATGYTGLEMAALLARHPEVEIAFATSESGAGGRLRTSHPAAPDLPLLTAAGAPLREVSVVFLCLPHTHSAPVAAQALAAGVRVVDLSADLRLADAALFAQWYHTEHPCPDLLPVPYGLPEIDRTCLHGASCIANPGCYPTATLLGLVPLARAGLILPDGPIVVDAKSGVSGAGRAAKQHLLFGEVAGNFSPYSIGRTHRHLAEIEQALSAEGIETGRLIFSPHLLPTDRGILNTMYIPVSEPARIEQTLREAYAGEPLVEVLPAGETATLAHVVRSPRAVLSVHPGAANTVIVVSAIDNLLKGAASQAVQNFNLMFSLPETMGLV